MRAMIYRTYGGPERLELVDIGRPSPGPGQVLVRVIASSVNPVDWKLASGRLRLFMPVKLPRVPGFDVAGDIAELGRGSQAIRSATACTRGLLRMEGRARARSSQSWDWTFWQRHPPAWIQGKRPAFPWQG